MQSLISLVAFVFFVQLVSVREITSTESAGVTKTETITAPLITCTTEGIFPYPGNCHRYYICTIISGTMFYDTFECPRDSYYNQFTTSCTVGTCPLAIRRLLTSPSITVKGIESLTRISQLTFGTNLSSEGKVSCDNVSGYIADPEDCTSFYLCSEGIAYPGSCPLGSFFNPTTVPCQVGTCSNN